MTYPARPHVIMLVDMGVGQTGEHRGYYAMEMPAAHTLTVDFDAERARNTLFGGRPEPRRLYSRVEFEGYDMQTLFIADLGEWVRHKAQERAAIEQPPKELEAGR